MDMMDMMALCIGGSLDGKFIKADQKERVIQRPVRRLIMNYEFDAQQIVPIAIERYELQIFRTQTKQYLFYVLFESPPIDVIEKLIVVYHADHWLTVETENTT